MSQSEMYPLILFYSIFWWNFEPDFSFSNTFKQRQLIHSPFFLILQLYSLKMNVSQIRDKYKQILDDSEDSDEENRSNFHKTKIPLGRTRILTQQNDNLSQSMLTDCQPSSKIVIQLKERIAQGIKNMALKEEEMSGLKHQIVKLEQKNKLLDQQLKNMRKSVEVQENKLIDQRVRIGVLEAEIKRLKEVIEATNVDKQLAFKQTQFYKKEIASLKSEKQGLTKKMQSMQKYWKQSEKIRSMNGRLKDDLKRMHVILNELSEKKDAKKLVDKHYLGKPYREHHHWFPQNLIGQVELFLKRQQIGQGNKDFLNNLVKFIDRYNQQIKKQKRQHTQITSKQDKSRMYSSSLCEKNSSIPKTQFLGKSTLKESILLSRYTKNGSKKYTQSLLYTEETNVQIKCEQILSEFYKIMQEGLNQKQIKAKRILRLVQEMSKSILSLFEEENNTKNF